MVGGLYGVILGAADIPPTNIVRHGLGREETGRGDETGEETGGRGEKGGLRGRKDQRVRAPWHGRLLGWVLPRFLPGFRLSSCSHHRIFLPLPPFPFPLFLFFLFLTRSAVPC